MGQGKERFAIQAGHGHVVHLGGHRRGDDVVIIVGDGLSASAIDLNAAPLLRAVVSKLSALGLALAPLVAEAWGAWGEKTLYGRKYMGIDRATFLIDKDGKVAKDEILSIPVTEVMGMEGEVIITQDLFTYEFKGETVDGKLSGTFKSSGLRPHFLPRAAYYGLDKVLMEVIG